MKRVVGASQVLTVTDSYVFHLVKPLDEFKSKTTSDCRHIRRFTFITSCGELIDYSRRLRFPDRWLFSIGRSFKESVTCPQCARFNLARSVESILEAYGWWGVDSAGFFALTDYCLEVGDENSVRTIQTWMRRIGWIKDQNPKPVAPSVEEVPF